MRFRRDGLVEHGDSLGEPVQRLLTGVGKSVAATLDAIEPAVDVALQDRSCRGDARHYAQFAQSHRSSCSERTDAAQRVLAISSDDRRSVAPTDVQISPAALEFAEQQGRSALRLARSVGDGVLDTVIAVSLFTASLAVAQVWDKAIYLRALQDTLVSDPV